MSFPLQLNCRSPEDRELVIRAPQHKAEHELSAVTPWLRTCFLLLYFYYLTEWDSAGRKLRPWNQDTFGSYINLGHLSPIYLLFQYTELAVLSITQSDSPLKLQCFFCIFWLRSFSDDLLEAVEWDQGKKGTGSALSTSRTWIRKLKENKASFCFCFLQKG